ncbi:hypothetical protein J2W95_003396 [Flavobacterium granuli]|uniref:Uncharacterized protein n=1 Tax=Flavobacterium granuli TaxID=280093 RepID=A0ABU1S6N1_9FLAO|nr:hypothetical protein [Flavobacterium granuli]
MNELFISSKTSFLSGNEFISLLKNYASQTNLKLI